MYRTLLTAVLFTLTGCATTGMSEAECQTADWRAVGFEDGSRGAESSSFGSHRQACAEHGVAPDFDRYLAGHSQGLENFCRPENGARLGANGYRYTGICPEHLEAAFLAEHESNFGLFERRSAIHAIDRRLSACKQRVRTIEHLFIEKTAAIIAPGLPPSERASIAVGMKQLGEEKAALQVEIHGLEHDRLEAQDDYDQFRSQVAYGPGGAD